MDNATVASLRDQLLDRRGRVETVVARQPGHDEATRLLVAIDAALARMASGSFGLCETCGDPIEADRLVSDPLVQYCLDHLTPDEERALQQDLDLAARVQRELLPRRDVAYDGWDLAYHYQALGPVSGDYCDLITGPEGDLYFLVGDVSGHGVAAAMLMSHLSAMVRTLISVGLPLDQLMERTSRVFCESTLPSHYATLVCGRARRSGTIEICNAGHPPPLAIRADRVEGIEATGVPIGLFCGERFASQVLELAPGESLLLYTDGVVEACNPAGEDFGFERLAELASRSRPWHPQQIVDTCLTSLVSFTSGVSFPDDVTILALRRA